MIHSTTILAVRHRDRAVLAGDGQVTFGQTVVKQSARKIRRLYNDRILAGFAGSAADSFALFARFESKLEQYRGNLERSAVELAKDWRSDRILRRLEAMLIVLDKNVDVPAVGHRRSHRARRRHRGDRIGRPLRAGGGARRSRATPSSTPATIAEKAMAIAGEICIYTNAQHRRRRAVDRADLSARNDADVDRVADAAPDRRRARQVRHRPGGGQARRGDRAAQPHAPPEAGAGAGRGGRAEEHPDDRADRRRQDRDRAAAGAARAVAVRQGRGVEVHRGRLRRPRRRVDGPRSRRARRRHGARGAARGGARQGGAERRGAAARPAAAADAVRSRRTRIRPRARDQQNQTRERFREQLRAGRLDARVVEIDVREKSFPVVRDHRRVVGRGGRHQPEGHAARPVPGQDEEAPR